MSCFVHGIGATVNLVNRDRTLLELERDIAQARAMGAPDDAIVVRTGSGSIYIGEIIWVGK